MRKFNTKNMISTFCYICINIVILVVILITKGDFNIVTIGSFLQIVSSIMIIFYHKKEFISIASLFLLLTYVFHFGQSIIITFGFEDVYSHLSILNATSEILYINAEYFAMISIFFITLGIVFSTRELNEMELGLQINEDEKTSIEELKSLRIVSLIVLSVSLLPLIYLDIQKIIAVRNFGYLSTYDTYSAGVNKYLALVAQFARPALTVLIISYKNNKKIAASIFYISTSYFIFMMLSGDRGTNMIYLLSNLFVYFKLFKKIKMKTVLYYSFIGYLMLGFLSTISILRDSSDITVESFIYYFRYRSGDGIIYSVLREFGSTLKTLIYSMRFTSESNNYSFGSTYLISFLGLFPKLPNTVVDHIDKGFTFTKSFPEQFQYSLGGSFLGELFYNFGWFGSVLSYFIGLFIGKLDRTVKYSIQNKKWLHFALVMILLPSLMIWIRGYFVEMLFKVFWLGGFLIVVNNILGKDDKKRGCN